MRVLFAFAFWAALSIAPAAIAAGPAAAPSPPSSLSPAPSDQSWLGEVAFANSGNAAAQAPFLRGLALLHDFEYPAAAAAFRQAEAADPGFAMAVWGEAMTYNHPVWMEQDKEAGEAALAQLGPTRAARLAKAATPRERAYLEAVDTLYGEGSKEARDQAYSNRMALLFAANPDDIDARAFYALSLLGLAHQGRDHALYMRAAALLEEVFAAHPRHPGVVHYLIHCYDDPVHAPLGLRAARLYGAIAPQAGHALHMTSHIFLALGLWPEVERANVQAMAVVNRQRTAAGRPESHCGHYWEWLVYARLEQGGDEAADVARCRADGLRELAANPAPTRIEPNRSEILSWADMAIRRLIETGARDPAPVPLPDGHYLETRFTLAYADLMAAGRDPARVRSARAALQSLAARLDAARSEEQRTDADAPRRQRIVLMQAAGLERLASGDAEGGLVGLRATAEAEAAMPVAFGPPLVEKPSFELLGDVLLGLGRFDEAASAYQSALAAAPNRRISVRGLALARQHRPG